MDNQVNDLQQTAVLCGYPSLGPIVPGNVIVVAVILLIALSGAGGYLLGTKAAQVKNTDIPVAPRPMSAIGNPTQPIAQPTSTLSPALSPSLVTTLPARCSTIPYDSIPESASPQHYVLALSNANRDNFRMVISSIVDQYNIAEAENVDQVYYNAPPYETLFGAYIPKAKLPLICVDSRISSIVVFTPPPVFGR